MDIRKGDIYWVSIPQSQTTGSEQYKRRPWVVVSRTGLNRGGTVVAVPLSSQIQKANQHRILVPLPQIIKDPTCKDNFTDSVALTEQIRVLAVSRLEQPRAASLSRTAIGALELALAFLLEID